MSFTNKTYDIFYRQYLPTPDVLLSTIQSQGALKLSSVSHVDDGTLPATIPCSPAHRTTYSSWLGSGISQDVPLASDGNQVRSWHRYQFRSSCSSLHAHSILLCNTAFMSVSHQADVSHTFTQE